MDSIALVGRLVLALAVVIGAMWLLARIAQKRGRNNRRGQVVSVLARQSVSRNSSIAIVRVMDRAMILGVSEGQITHLGDADLDAIEELTAAAAARPARPVPSPRPAHASRPTHAVRSTAGGVLAGSALSTTTWKQAVDAVRDRTVRRS
jgi:flagellar protein FliO/FliZ